MATIERRQIFRSLAAIIWGGLLTNPLGTAEQVATTRQPKFFSTVLLDRACDGLANIILVSRRQMLLPRHFIDASRQLKLLGHYLLENGLDSLFKPAIAVTGFDDFRAAIPSDLEARLHFLHHYEPDLKQSEIAVPVPSSEDFASAARAITAHGLTPYFFEAADALKGAGMVLRNVGQPSGKLVSEISRKAGSKVSSMRSLNMCFFPGETIATISVNHAVILAWRYSREQKIAFNPPSFPECLARISGLMATLFQTGCH
jgi:hypothetical protein